MSAAACAPCAIASSPPLSWPAPDRCQALRSPGVQVSAHYLYPDFLRSLGGLAHLTALTLSKGDLEDWPTSLTALRQLRVLDLSANPHLPAEAVERHPWGRHPHLSALSLSGCRLARLPREVLELRRLKVWGWGHCHCRNA